jgi:hypothetical protein
VQRAIYPGTWDEAYRGIVAPALKKAKDIDLALEPLFAVDQIAKAQAARGAPPSTPSSSIPARALPPSSGACLMRTIS